MQDDEPPIPPGRRGSKLARRFEAPEPVSPTRRSRVPKHVLADIEREVGSDRAPRIGERLGQAARAYDRGRFQDAKKILEPLLREAPAAPDVREMYGLTLYRLGRWNDALRQLETFHELTGSFDEYPAMADSWRALRRHDKVDELWGELAAASPSAEVVAEGRIVAAGSLADRGDVPGAIALLEGPAKRVSRPRDHHLRMWYALADLYERAGDVPAARQLFGRILSHDADFFDTAERLSALG